MTKIFKLQLYSKYNWILKLFVSVQYKYELHDNRKIHLNQNQGKTGN
jgi:hypothetical protein